MFNAKATMKYKTTLFLTLNFILQQGISFGQQKSVTKIGDCFLQADTVIHWTAKDDTFKFVYLIQQFKWNRWITCDSIQSLNQKDSVKYSFKVSKYIHTGQNQFRIKANNITPKLIISKTVIFKAMEIEVFKLMGHFDYYKTNSITFKQNTYYELYDRNGKQVKCGYGKSFFINDLPKDIYYLNFDNKMTEIKP